MELYHNNMLVFMALILTIQHCQTLQQYSNYVKPHENTTCLGDPCLTLEAYTDAADTYFISDVEFIFMNGDHYFNASLRLTNISNIHFHGEELLSDYRNQTIRIIFAPLAKLVFDFSNNITFSHLSVTLGGSQTGLNDLFQTIAFQDSSAQLFDALFQGSDDDNISSTAVRCHSSHINMSNVKIMGAKSRFGAALILYNSTATLSGNNTFANNSAPNEGDGGAIYALESTITLSGTNTFEENSASVGGAIVIVRTIMEFTGTALFVYNKALFGGAGYVQASNLTLNNGNFYFIKNSAQLGVGGAMMCNFANTVHVRAAGSVIMQGNIAMEGGAISMGVFSTFVCIGKAIFKDNLARSLNGGAIVLHLSSQMYLSGAVIENNYADSVGGGIMSQNDSNAIIENSLMIGNGAGVFGGAVNCANQCSIQFRGINHFENNWSSISGGGINVYNSELNFTGSNFFTNNTAISGGGLTLSLSKVSVQGTLQFTNNRGRRGGAVYEAISKLNFDRYAAVTFSDNVATQDGGACYCYDSTWNIRGTISFSNNSAFMGGAMSITTKSKLIFNRFSDISYIGNHADRTGGSIFFGDALSEDRCQVFETDVCLMNNSTIPLTCRRISDCFIELDADLPLDPSNITNISIRFLNNSAGKSGTVLFGGSLDNCRLYLGGGFVNSCGNRIEREYTENSLQAILRIFTIDNLTSAISSEPFRVCFCDHNGVPDCDMNIAVETIRGKQFTLSAVTVGQGNFTVPSSIKVDFGNSTSTTLSRLQRVQDTANTCTNISYRLFSAEDSVIMILFPDGPCRDTGIARHEVRVTFLPCPDGFLLIGAECMCDRQLNVLNITCNVDTKSINRNENNFWMMALYDNASYQGLILHNARCPFDFCMETAVEVNLENPDIQCDHNHSGILCGSCRENFSIALGSLHCVPCNHAYLTLIFMFALAGIALVILLLFLQLTVANGAINGLIFYANVIQVNQDIFFHPSTTNILTAFIAWLNLDLGIEICLYDGMNTYAFIWLQFVFPFYVWFLIGFIIFLSRYSPRISRWLGDNPVSVLATLFILSYSKILNTIIAVLSRTTLQYPDGSYQHVWLYDGSVPYFKRVDHIVLGVFAISALCLLFLPYTILLLCGQWFQAYSHWKILSWINKLKPFMDAYHAPFKKETRYWTGFLLLVRCALFLTFAFNALSNSSVNLLTITSVTIGLAAWAWLHKGLYEKIHNDILEACFILNLCILAGATYHVKEIAGNQDILAYTSVGVTFAIFCGILLYHAFLRMAKTSIWKNLKPLNSMKHSKCLTRMFSHNNDTKDNETCEQANNGRWADTRSMQLPTATIIELNEPLLDYQS